MPWSDLYKSHQSLRANGKQAIHDIRKALNWYNGLTPMLFNDRMIAARFQPVRNHQSGLLGYSLSGADGEYLAVWNLPEAQQKEAPLHEARLLVQLLLSGDSTHIHMLTVAVAGRRKGKKENWTLAVHLPDDRGENGDRQGHGACGHAALHCHVGPDAYASPKVRSPMPPVGAGALVQWAISQVVPTKTFEPALWEDIVTDTP